MAQRLSRDEPRRIKPFLGASSNMTFSNSHERNRKAVSYYEVSILTKQ